MTRSNVAGFPRIGPNRELKFATEGYFQGKVSREDLLATASKIRLDNWRFMKEAGIDLIPSNDFSFYDQMLDTTALLGAVPNRYAHTGGQVDLDTYFAMARGRQSEGVDVTACEMVKWFDSNYHYIVPEIGPDTQFSLSSSKPFDEFSEAKQDGIDTIPVLIGPVTYLLLSKPAEGAPSDFSPLSRLGDVLAVYEEVIGKLGDLGAEWVQLDEPAFVEDRTREELSALDRAYERLGAVQGRPKIVIKTYFDHVGEAYPVLANLGVEGIGLDFVRGSHNEELISQFGGLAGQTLFAGVVDGRNIWINDLEPTLALLDRLDSGPLSGVGEIIVSTSSSLQHLPVDLEAEKELDPEVRSWIAFAKQKVAEVSSLTLALGEGPEAISEVMEANKKALESRLSSPRARNPEVRSRLESLTESDAKRRSEFKVRHDLQREVLKLPLFPSTTIGSFPQTEQIRHERAVYRKGGMSEEQYEEAIRKEIEHVVRFQEEAGLDVLVHGEAERNDMVQYFAEQLEGCAFTKSAWVQSYGTRYVQPPIIFGDVVRPKAMTVDWITYSQSLTDKPIKGMLTGPVTMLMWSFVRDDQPRSETCKQLALAVRDEVADLEAAGVQVIQVDEPALREGLPLRHDRWQEYLDWAVFCFRVATSGVKDETQVQTHLCYSEFGDIIESVAALDADVNLMWCARAGMRLLDDLQRVGYQNEVGPGVYDIHSPRIPPVEEMVKALRAATEVLDPHQIWVNPDCGLKTRAWDECGPALRNMVEAAQEIRKEFTQTK